MGSGEASRKSIFVLSVVIVLIATGCQLRESEQPLQPERPNIFVNQAELEAVKRMVEDGREPWKSAFDQLIGDAEAALSGPLYSVIYNGGPSDGHLYLTDAPYTARDGIIDPAVDRADYNQATGVGRNVRNLGLAYALTGEGKYADRAVQLIRAWCLARNSHMIPAYSEAQSRIEISITMPGIFYGADFLYDYPGWHDEEKQVFTDWVSDLAASAMEWEGTNNFENWRINLIAAAGALLRDPDLLEYAFDKYKAIIPAFIDEDGRLPEELKRTNSLSYSLYALNAMVQTAEIARHHGVNLYDYTSDGTKGLKLALDYHAPHAANPAGWPYEQMAEVGATDNMALFELAYSFWREPSYLKVVQRYNRPLTEIRVLGPVSLTHADRFELGLEPVSLSVPDAFDGTVKPVAAGGRRFAPLQQDVPGIVRQTAKRAPVPLSSDPRLAVADVSASADDGNVPGNTIDEDMNTRWSAEGSGQWIVFDLGAPQTVSSIDIGWYRGDSRVARFDIEVSEDNRNWKQVYSGSSSGTTSDLEHVDFDDVSARYVRIVGLENSVNKWNSILEVIFYGKR